LTHVQRYIQEAGLAARVEIEMISQNRERVSACTVEIEHQRSIFHIYRYLNRCGSFIKGYEMRIVAANGPFDKLFCDLRHMQARKLR
jgi:hypothetical protein